ncbi:TetR family transcriptional regulator [Curtobacterium flaccumfaciens]|uniref:TetR family transcriptional regulator n=1 Tax=Curtobacterium flaccumfaciens TaxID=2035 RepID=UPI003425934C
MHRSTLTEDRLAAAETICSIYVSRGTTRVPIAELASAAGISERTFHRYFPSKSDTVQPLFEENSRSVNSLLAESSGVRLRTTLSDAHEQMFGATRAARTAALFPLLFKDRAMWSAFLGALHDGELGLHPILAARLKLDDSAPRALAASGAFTAANRIALEQMVTFGADRRETFEQVLDAFGAELFDPGQHGAATR